MLNPVLLAAMGDELEKIAADEKDADFSELLTKAKDALTTPIPGTKPWLLGREEAAREGMKRGVKSLAGDASKRLGNGSFDVSSMAKRLGVLR